MNQNTMSLSYGKVGITLIGSPGSGKSTLGRIIHKKIPTILNFHDHDDHGLEPELIRISYLSIADAIEKIGDREFLNFEEIFTTQNYGRTNENKKFSLDNTLFTSSGSLVRSETAIEHIRTRTHIIFLDTPIDTVITQIHNRSGGSGRIIGINGGPNEEEPMNKSLEEELTCRYELYRRYQDSILEHRPRETPETTAMRLLKHIQDILRNS